MVGAIKTNQEKIQNAIAKVGEQQFTARADERAREGWPMRFDLDSDRFYAEKVANHKSLAAVEVAMEILGQ